MKEFVYTSAPARVVFGAGSLRHLGREIDLLHARRVLVLTTPEQAAMGQGVVQSLGARAAGLFTKAVMHVPVETVRAASVEAQRLHVDCVVAIGGGSTLGLAKALALEDFAGGTLPLLAIPTTYAGSEMTPIYGLTEAGVKKTGKDSRVLPRTVIYDPELTVSLPARLSVTSGLNAIAHAAEGLYAQNGNPVMALMAEEGIRAMAAALPLIVGNPADLEARGQGLYGAWLCGTVLGNVGMALHHKLCHTLGGTFNLPHAETHAVMLPHSIAYNAPAIPAALAALGRALGKPDPARALFDLAARLGAPASLAAIGMPAEGIERAAELATRDPYWNPRPIERESIAALLRRAWAGEAPA